ncbi:hypothetical protein H6P81_005326 [Aristolochia fimbriata]|uniref:Bifunctional inhibitor/plant lipid transfer protein/seed storage helical domain-containing protein n=1 Tax=Aristolochia fimbriata TaxID=158543 RepID=A0AAV7EU92_ARIFI|nr:hypothetical protein H6P81_005326 [Aristolochia fimbriata]
MASLFTTQFRFLLVLVLASIGRSDFQADRAECQNGLLAMASCIGYVSVNSRANQPTPDCCKGVIQVLEKQMKCLCLLIKDRNEPMLGINFNITRSLSLPVFCKTHTNISECIDLLHVPADSTEAKDFKHFAAMSPSLSTPFAEKGNSSSGGNGAGAGAGMGMESRTPVKSSGGRARMEAIQLVLGPLISFLSLVMFV